MRKAIVYWPVGPVCRSCYVRARAYPAQCRACGLVRVLIAESPAASGDQVELAVYGPCAGSRHAYLCSKCGNGDEPYKNGVCVRCAVEEKLTTAFTGPDGQLSQQARRIIDAMTRSRRPRSVLQWWSNSNGGAHILRETFSRGDKVTHELLDRTGEQKVWSLRRTLIDVGVLPERDETLAQLQTRIRRIAAAAPPRHRHLLLTYGTWRILRAAHRRRERTGRFTAAQVRSAERRLTGAADLLSWLDQHNLALEDLTQADVERWSENRALAREAADFLRWTRRRRFARELTIPYPPRTDPDIILSEDDRWRLLTTCLQDSDLPTDLRVAGALLLLYGLPLTRIVELTRDHLDPPEATVITGLRIASDSPPIAIPPALGRLLTQLPTTPHNPSAVALIDPAERPAWLFPGRSARGTVNASVISKRLKDYGIQPRASRNAALIALAADLPTSVLADLFGISITSAIQWTHRAARNWNAYIAATITAKRAAHPSNFLVLSDQ
ncbi:hypothetical protein [Kribbella endophytica]